MPLGDAHRLAFACLVSLAALASACAETNVHDSKEAAGQPCIKCHATAYQQVQTPVHLNQFPQTCGDCHSTKAWVPSVGGGHPETKFPIMTGSHANKAIGCTDCHLPSLGANTGGQNTDCVHCHIGAHTTPSIDSAHTKVPQYTPSAGAAPNYCLSCHPTG
jgi:hypothetical protein